QAFYPYWYSGLLGVPDPSMVLVLTARNILYVALFAWAVLALAEVVRRPLAERARDQNDPVGLSWMRMPS
ncbi:MAG TPA: hypothetical protein VNS80_09470, partial [Pseudolysinimonas sp.]|nr:hypothetical protein [Pseudolysinimonas sp.]